MMGTKLLTGRAGSPPIVIPAPGWLLEAVPTDFLRQLSLFSRLPHLDLKSENPRERRLLL